MKKFLLAALFLVILQFSDLFAYGGELTFKGVNYPTLKVTVKASSNVWMWDSTSKTAIPWTWKDTTFTSAGSDISFDAPKGIDGYKNVVPIPWGLFNIKLEILNTHDQPIYTTSFNLDLRDENWSQNRSAYINPDTYIKWDDVKHQWYLKGTDADNDTSYITNNSTKYIWRFWKIGIEPKTNNFKIPITLRNRTEGGSTNFGYLKANGREDVISGQTGNFRFDTEDTVLHGTKMQNGSYSFKWTDINNVNPVSTQNYYDSTLNFTIPENFNNKSITRLFHPVYRLTVRNNIGELGLNADTIFFKDPTTTNLLEKKSASGSGFIKNDAFKDLSIRAGGLDNQKYALKAKNTIIYGGRVYQWYTGDFNPSTQTDITITDSTTKTAYYKGSLHSNTQSAFTNSSQRKFIRTPNDGYYHIVYESMGKIWYERSTDGGATWTLQNNGKPLNTDYVFVPGGGGVSGSGSYTTAKHPSIDYYGNNVLIVWEEQSGSNYVVRLAFLTDGLPKEANEIPFQSYGLFSEDIYPEIAVKDNGFAVIAIRRNDNILKGLEVHYITLVNASIGRAADYCSAKIPGTDQNTGLFTLAADKNGSDKYHIAWQQNLASGMSSMMYTKFIFTWAPGEIPPGGGSYVMNIVKSVTVSDYTSYEACCSPSMIGAADGSARLSFKGHVETGSYSIATLNPDNFSFISLLRKYSGEVYSPQISQGTETYYVGWTELNNGSYKTIVTDASTLKVMETLNGSFGRDMQINPGGARNQQYAMSFNSESTSLPYFFTRSSEAIGMIVAKKLAIKSGRGISLTKDESQMYFILGNVTSEGSPVDFIEAQDTVRLDGDLKKVNSFMTTKPFSLKDNSSLSFAVIYGTKDSSISKSNVKEGQFASFKVEMIDDATGRVLGSYLSEKMDKTNIFRHKEGVYKISSDGIGSKLVRLRVSVDENMKSEYTISDMFFGEGLPLSKSLKEHEMGLAGSMEIKEYALSQNYPNPFNPTTIVSYAIPKPSKVTLKVYDILGKEVAALVNGFKEIGKYSVEFNASALPSGIYIYEIRANDFVKSGKMMLLK